MARDIHSVSAVRNGEVFLVFFDDRHRSETVQILESWSIDPSLPLTDQDADKMIRDVIDSPEIDVDQPASFLRGGLGSLGQGTSSGA